MQLEHSFTVPASADTVWKALLDPERVASCMPGATITSAGDGEFAGTVKVRLGPVSLLYKGTGTYTSTDDDARRAVIEATGRDSRGNGTASATVTLTVSEQDGAASVLVLTDMAITGKPAQFGRGLITEVGNKITGQFADCLAGTLGESDAVSDSPDSGVAAPGTGAATGDGPSAVAPAQTSGAGSAGASTGTTRPRPAAPADEIDLLDAAGGAVAKRLVPVAVAAAVVIAVVVWFVRR